jgi:hypothetical protein
MMSAGQKIGLVILLLALALVGCSGRSSLRRGWVETSGLSHLDIRYNTFDGVERRSFRAAEGQDINLEAALQVEDGSLTVRLLDPSGELIWEESYTEDAEFSLAVEAERKGRYKLQVEGESAEGGFALDWEVRG